MGVANENAVMKARVRNQIKQRVDGVTKFQPYTVNYELQMNELIAHF